MKYSSTSIPDAVLRRMPRDQRPKGKAGLTFEEAAAKATVRVERDLHLLVSRWLTLRGIKYLTTNPARRSTATLAWPDFSFAIKGRAVAIELKMPGVAPRADQVECHEAMRANGWVVLVLSCFGDVVESVRGME